MILIFYTFVIENNKLFSNTNNIILMVLVVFDDKSNHFNSNIDLIYISCVYCLLNNNIIILLYQY